MSKKLFSRVLGFFRPRSFVGTDKHGNRYFTRKEEIDGVLDPTRKKWRRKDGWSLKVMRTPLPFQEMMELEARRERVRLNVALLKKEEEQRKAKQGAPQRRVKTGKVEGPDLKSFIQQLKGSSHHDRGEGLDERSDVMDGIKDSRSSKSEMTEKESSFSPDGDQKPVSSEPTGSGPSFKPGTWQPPT